MEITGSTKLTELLREFPWLPEELMKLSDKFKMMKTPVGKVMMKKATVADMGSRSGIGEEELLRKLRQMIRTHEGP